MANSKSSTASAVSSFKVRDTYPEKEFSNKDKQKVAIQIARQLNLSKTKE